jgi:hypothetical protein
MREPQVLHPFVEAKNGENAQVAENGHRQKNGF